MSETSLLVLGLTTLASAVPATFTLAATILTSLLLPAVFAVVLGIADLLGAILASIESVAVLVFSRSFLLLPFRLAWLLLGPFAGVAGVVLAPVLYPFEGVLVCVGAVVGLFLEFKALYTFLTTGAIVGILVGIILWRISRTISWALGWLDEPAKEPHPAEETLHRRRPRVAATPSVVVTPPPLPPRPPKGTGLAAARGKRVRWHGV